ncbi:MAG: acetyl-CoA carboxylase biotin carboxyl carrier protein [Verrucomicrobiales bacterium]|nr:acetyl-CoA carboxylase biotin carboxyl carrier protein [Verrucomicrobiales bacterium]
MEFKDIKSIVDLMKKNSISDFEMEKEGFKIKLRRTDGTKTEDVQVQHYLPPASAAPIPMPAAAPAAPAAAPVEEPAASNDPEIKSPMIGTFYRAPSPESDSYVEIGDHVTADTVVCIVEAMKVMNEIKAEVSGVITEILVENGNPVEFGQPLYRVRPA